VANRVGLRTEPDGARTLVRTTWAGAVEPVIDSVVSIDFRILAAAAPPRIDEATADGAEGLASYGPPPPRADDVDPDGLWPDGEHCAVTRDASGAFSRLTPWGGEGDAVQMPIADLLDGPWCPHPSAADAYDADLFRVRAVQLVLRLEATPARLRGAAGALFTRGGHADALRWLPDRDLVLTIARR
jgi:hypothetical protein